MAEEVSFSSIATRFSHLCPPTEEKKCDFIQLGIKTICIMEIYYKIIYLRKWVDRKNAIYLFCNCKKC